MESTNSNIYPSLDTAITAEHAINILNQALELDYQSISSLINYRVTCNDNLANHQSIQVNEQAMVGFLGILNGIFGADKDNCGYIAAEYDDVTHKLIRFCRYKK